jgi:hypothetical protein
MRNNGMKARSFHLGQTAALAAALAAASVSCQKVISVDLNNADPQTVIEAVVTDGQGPYTVTLSKSGDYFSPSLNFPPITHAFVTIGDNSGVTDTLTETVSGTYHTSVLHGSQGRIYSLRVVAEGKEYDAVSTMPLRVPIDTLVALRARESDGDQIYNLYVFFKDPPEPGNYYRMNIRVSVPISPDSIDGRRYHLYNDKLTNGNEAMVKIRMRNYFSPGDTVWVDLLSIDRASYDYFNTLNNILTSDRSPTSLAPANPTTDLTNGALGYFAAYSVDSKMLILQ